MILKVDPDELLDVIKVMKKDSDRLKNEIKNMQSSVEIVRANWKGMDADAFTANFDNFLKKMETIPSSIDTFAEVCDKTNKGYTSRDEQFARELKEGAVDNEQ